MEQGHEKTGFSTANLFYDSIEAALFDAKVDILKTWSVILVLIHCSSVHFVSISSIVFKFDNRGDIVRCKVVWLDVCVGNIVYMGLVTSSYVLWIGSTLLEIF